MKIKHLLAGVACLHLYGCQTYEYADNVKMLAFTDDFSEGKSVGNIEGKDCLMGILGYDLGPVPTLDRAMLSAQNQVEAGVVDRVGFSEKKGSTASLRYINNVSTSWEGWDAVIMRKRCLVVKGKGYK